MKRILLELEDGTSYPGYSFGAKRSAAGEVVFNTGMVGYPQALTDPSYHQQILVCTYPLIGNYGVPRPDPKDPLAMPFESDRIHVAGLVVSDYSAGYSHHAAAKSLGFWLAEHRVPGICGIDTRALTKRLRDEGTMLGRIMYDEEPPFIDPNLTNLVSQVTVPAPRTYGSGGPTVALIDCGCKHNIIRSFLKRGVRVVRVPYDFDLSAIDFDGLFISNGPGDPKMCAPAVRQLRGFLKEDLPVFGICLGIQLMALASGADTYKLPFGHRSQNQPCLETGTKRCVITSQNHGYAVDGKALRKGWHPWFENANDGTIEGIRCADRPHCAVQFHPEAMPGPTDTDYLFDRFVSLLRDRQS
ncbi:glutamine-hydrolyzing carbamoyl-phosphate synthase small subunit [Candidatus Woesearchaeota archaeon]|nr:glutamine-hydrolyzing carbamoyl-phosphate synthase small subunit [Candidatus Woesearchaeota archaeon]